MDFTQEQREKIGKAIEYLKNEGKEINEHTIIERLREKDEEEKEWNRRWLEELDKEASRDTPGQTNPDNDLWREIKRQ